MKISVGKVLTKRICSLLLAIAPVLAVNLQSTVLWGEPPIPNSLKNQ